MKKTITATLTAFAFIFTTAVSAQVKQTIKIPVEQVPLAVTTTFNKEFSSLPADGSWSVFVETSHNTQRTSAKPLWYSYSRRSKSEKIEVRFTPQGEVALVTGVERGESRTVKRQE